MNHQRFERSSGAQMAVVYVHGILGSPVQFIRMDRQIEALGVDALAVLLPGHGASSGEFAKSTYTQWLANAREEIERMRQKYAKLVLIGHSMGGLLNLLYAADHRVEGLILINTPMRVHVTPTMLRMGARAIFTKPSGHDDDHMRVYRESYGVVNPRLLHYPLFLKPMAGLQKLIAQTKACLKDVHAPALIIQSLRDETVIPASAQLLFDALCGASNPIVYLEKSYHVYFPPADEAYMLQQVLRLVENCGG